MMKKLAKIFAISLCLLTLIGIVPAFAKVPYTTYTYGITGLPIESPHAYVPERVIDSDWLIETLENEGNEDSLYRYGDLMDSFQFSQLADVFVDDLNWVYISDKGANRVIVCDKDYNLKYIISTFINDQGVQDSLSAPEGLFVTETEIYVADSANARIVIFDKVGNFKEIVPEPANEVMPDNSVYTPVAVAVDKAGRMYIVSSTTHYGIISMNRDGSFNGFVGAQKTTPDLWQYFWRMFQTPEQIAATIKNVPTEYNNVTIDEGGFIYATISSIDESAQQSAITSKSRAGTYAPVKKLNPNGTDVMKRTGFWPPSGEVFISWDNGLASEGGASRIVDVALGPNGMWSIIDEKRSKIFTYDQEGNNLFNFGDIGRLEGNIQKIKAIDFQDSNILCVDATENTIVVYKRTGYGDLIDAALENTNKNQYQNAVNYFVSILQKNNNYAQAYVGIGQSKMLSGEYTQAMNYAKYANDYELYSEAFGEARKEWIEKNVYFVPLIIVVAIILINKFFKLANKINKKGQKMKDKRKLYEEYFYAFHVIFHPFDGFWDLKHEKRGSVKGAVLILVLTIVSFIYFAIGRGYLYSPETTYINYFAQINFVLMPVLLWTTANWGLTTLFDGEGSYKDVFVTTCYALTPLQMILIPTSIIYNVVTIEESAILGMVIQFAYIWAIFLVFFGMMVIHDYGLFKNLITSLASVVGVGFIMFIAALFGTLLYKLFSLGYGIYVELSMRM